MSDIKQVDWKEFGGGVITFLCHALLMRAGGEQTFTTQELDQVAKDYDRIRFALDEEKGEITMTLKARDYVEPVQ